MTINLRDYEGKSVVITLRSGWRGVSTVHLNNYASRSYYAYIINDTYYFNDGRVLINTESMSDIVDIELVDEEPRETSEPVITRVEVITHKREYVNWNKDNVITTSLQDEGRTLKVFVNTKTTEEPEMPITKPVFKEQQILVKIIPQLNSLASVLWDDGNPQRGRKLDKIIEELGDILYQEDT